nr:hypothetical protein [uncultured Ruminococcus sp.]
MVKKLIKYDFQSYFRLLFPVQLIILGIALINRLIQLFEPKEAAGTLNTVYNGFFISSLTLYFIAIAVCLVMTLVVSIVRFYQGMYTNEGYLNHTLPVTPTQHITAKLLNSMLFYIGTLFVIFISFIIITFGELNIEIFKAGFYLLNKFIGSLGAQGVVLIIEAVILVLLLGVHSFLKLYCCISVGQLAKKKKVLLAFGVYFGLYMAKQLVGTVFIIFAVINSVWINDIMNQISEQPWLLLLYAILYYVVVSAVYFVLNNYIMSKKLNLA